MGSDAKFWLGIWSVGAAVIVSIGLTISGYYSYRATVLRDIVKAGVDPLRASCAMSVDRDTMAICGMVASH